MVYLWIDSMDQSYSLVLSSDRSISAHLDLFLLSLTPCELQRLCLCPRRASWTQSLGNARGVDAPIDIELFQRRKRTRKQGLGFVENEKVITS